jgi:hypothetical protein
LINYLCLFDNIIVSVATKMCVPDPAGSVINWPPGSGLGC